MYPSDDIKHAIEMVEKHLDKVEKCWFYEKLYIGGGGEMRQTLANFGKHFFLANSKKKGIFAKVCQKFMTF